MRNTCVVRVGSHPQHGCWRGSRVFQNFSAWEPDVPSEERSETRKEDQRVILPLLTRSTHAKAAQGLSHLIYAEHAVRYHRQIQTLSGLFLQSQAVFICSHVGHRLGLLDSSLWRRPGSAVFSGKETEAQKGRVACPGHTLAYFGT